jgi:V8-like Glu-specific endopeptidase
MRLRLACTAVFVAALAGCGATPASESEQQAASPIAGGTLDVDDAAVFQVFTRFEDSVASCTASLIAPNVLLTARHCISVGKTENVICGRSPFSAPVAGRDTVATNATQPANDSPFYHGADVRVPSDGSDLCGFDMALIILSSPVPASKATPLVPRIDRPVVAGEAYRAVGYGVDDVGERNPGRMERGDLEVSCLSGECGRIGVASTEFLGETGVCSGDSGGPALDEAGKVIGVVSRGSDPCETPIYGQVSSWGTWITETVLEAAENAGYRPPFWAFSGSSDLDPTLTHAGSPCADTSECTPGTVCYYDSDPATAACTEVCANDRQCGTSHSCRLGFDVQGGGLCVDPPVSNPGSGAGGEMSGGPNGGTLPPEHGADDSCSIRAGRQSSPASAWLVVLLGLASAFRTRTTRRRAR